MIDTVSNVNAGSKKPPVGFYQKAGKRLIDLLVSTGAILVLTPLLGVVAIFVKLSSPGPVFYCQERVGQRGRKFRIIKFRSMRVNGENLGPGVTVSGDPRITTVGKWLRKLKLDEIPQFWNVLKGEMSLVGPRPELPSYVRTYTAEQTKVLSVRPGITDSASIAYRHEENILASSVNPEEFYKTVVLPHKLALNLQYIERQSLAGDLVLVVETFLAVFSPSKRETSVGMLRD